ncbi:MAG TPA: hypothetical protein DEE98_08760 [Elusimicrobia bacterium]|nr:MAG: hypothetical protein A2204_04550 [Elusimicrobia bacterium RIFOXYA1_FULL_47_7]OGS15695.1 MAG: hypothetical protein A2251_08380 [Elusimicrobia bacterium RIFOXYA2_FULL_47_53]OGS27086.1 MAG: hypothetical protein A2339_01240 [Elusimicrobia bacterium RIFOXYB12_FULL_50_12]OGS30996.1 MAG: hypothetical protein A2323_06700 [Elusimicrobia bacterium RIFOXYB2_FULL_46_23]HBU70452.1 hypothetical protein [Elusimicrobiota bacterium]
MRKVLVSVLCLTVGLLVADLGFAASKKTAERKAEAKSEVASPAIAKSKLLMVADFDSGELINNLGGAFGAWNKDPNDKTQGCKADFIKPGYGEKGQSLMITYDVDSSNPSYNGLWMKLEDQNLTGFSKLSFWVKGDKDAGFTNKFKVELKSSMESSFVYVEYVGENWNLVEIPFAKFNKITNWNMINEFVIVFEDSQVTKKSGAIYVDEIAFVK